MRALPALLSGVAVTLLGVLPPGVATAWASGGGSVHGGGTTVMRWAGADPTEAEPTGTEPTRTEPAGTEPASAEPPRTEPAGTEPAGTKSAGAAGPAPPGRARPGSGGAVPVLGRIWPVGPGGSRPRVVRGWEPPATPYGRGHRGVDLAAAPGAPVRAVAPGRVSFAGRVAGRGVVSVELTGTGEPPLRTTYGPVRAAVAKGDEVAAGDILGALEADASTPGRPHCPSSCLHWGLLRADAYLDPLSLLPPSLLRGGPSRLLPVAGVPEPGS
ncbi:hypothetical protein GCM10010145_46290 [Streptomyces ruber]|uniref:M23ase beta-sheet core domain-containing protein n=3 Tax=Streptomyces TaxID=1883 RepID=A0A918EUS3_9ACTN|nr:M23 family metallopeptidase [Streptomyces ruber]GGQ71243.1 hypothetical protein GCM10010145_46290 [Streptomyces ruber]